MKYHCLKEWIRKDLISSSYITAIASSCISIFYFFPDDGLLWTTRMSTLDVTCIQWYLKWLHVLKVINFVLTLLAWKPWKWTESWILMNIKISGLYNSCTAKLSYNEPLYNEVLILTNNYFLYPSNSKVYDFKRTLKQWNLDIANKFCQSPGPLLNQGSIYCSTVTDVTPFLNLCFFSECVELRVVKWYACLPLPEIVT